MGAKYGTSRDQPHLNLRARADNASSPSTTTLTGNAAALDTSGSAGWFEPTAPISSLVFTFTQRSGLPVYQTWFAALARDVSGTVTDVSPGAGGVLGGVTLTLFDPSGVVLATTTAPDGTYLFDTVQPGTQTLTVTAPDGYVLQSSPEPVVVPEGSGAPITDQDFVLVADEPTGPTTDPPTTDPSTTEPPTGPPPTADPTSTSPAPSTLADTGVEAGPLVGSGVLLVVIGCAVAVVRRRRSLG